MRNVKLAINQRKAGTILSYVYIFLSNTISLFYTPIFLNILGQSEYGLIGTANSITSYLSLLSMGVGGAYIRFNAKARATGSKEEEYKINGMFQTIYFVVSAVTLVVGVVLIFSSSYIFSAHYDDAQRTEIKLIMLCTVIQFVVTFLFNTTAMALQAYERFFFIRMCLIISCIVQPIVNLIFLYFFNANAVTISLITLVISTLTYISYYIFARTHIGLKFVFGNFDKSLLKSIFVFSGFLFLNSITDQLTFTTDNIVLGVTAGAIPVAIYTVGSNFKGYFMSFSTSISSVFAPQVNQIIANKGDKKFLDEIFIKVGRVQFYVVALILTGYLFFGRQFVLLWVGDKYGDAYLIGLFLMLAITIPCFQNVGLEIQKAKNMHKARSIVYFLIAIVNVIITIPMSIAWGGKGAALATLICMFCGTVVFMNIYNQIKVGIDIIGFWKNIIRILPGLIIPCITGVIINSFIYINSYLSLIFFILLYCIVFAISIWFISMNQYEKDLVLGPIKKLFRKEFKAKVK